MKIVRVRRAQPVDADLIRQVVTAAFAASEFGHNGEADLVDQLCTQCVDAHSLVAETEGRVVGHILFTPVTIDSDPPCHGMGLAPLSVLPEFQRRGVGSELTRRGIDILKQAETPFAVVLGHPGYYQRFGFRQASVYGVRATFDVPEELFMIQILNGDDRIRAGVAHYRPEFNQT